MFDEAPARRFFGDFINFSDPFLFSSLFSRFLRYKLNSFLVVMALLLNHDGFGIAAGIKKIFSSKKSVSPPPSLSSQLSHLSRFLKVLEN